MPDPTSFAKTFDAEHPFAVGWDPVPGPFIRHRDKIGREQPDQIDIIRDPDNFGPCLICQRPTDWHLLDQGQRICSGVCLERAISHIESLSTGLADLMAIADKHVPQLLADVKDVKDAADAKPIPNLRRYPRPKKPSQKPCGGCGKAKSSQK